jgi:hypothetical protein
MRDSSARFLVIVVLGGLLMLMAVGAATAQEMPNVAITSPAQGATVSGIVNVVGSVEFPDFQKYEIFYKMGDDLFWGATVYTPVENGILARLDTKVVADGAYQLIVRQVHSNSQYDDFAGPMITVNNDLEVPRPHPEIHTSPLYPPFAGALARIENCSGVDLEFDYTGAEGGCSSAALWIMGRDPNSPICETVDVLLIPCEYRGTAWGTGEERARTYSFIAEHGKIYEILYPGGDQLFINEIPGDDPNPEGLPIPTATPGVISSRPAEQALPVSGQAASISTTPFGLVAGGLILLMVIGGVVAMRRERSSAE